MISRLAVRGDIRVRRNIHSCKQSHKVTHGQSHHRRVTTAHALNRFKLQVLDGIRAGLVERVAGLDIGLDRCIRIISHRDVRHAQVSKQLSGACFERGQAGVDLVCMCPQPFEHVDSICRVPGLSMDRAIEYDGCVCCYDYQCLPCICQGSTRFCFCQSENIICRGFAGALVFIHVRGGGSEGPVPESDQLSATGRIRRQQDDRSFIHE